MNTAPKTGLSAAKFASKKLVHKAVKATGDFFEKKIGDTIAKSCDDKIIKPKANPRNTE